MSIFHRVLLGLHAQARRIDRDQALLGALGVGAIAYAHQVDNVQRMVTDTNCRWLLADEVGLGKTVQAIMVMRALAAQSPRKLNVTLVVPEELVAQWTEELLCRGHILPTVDQEESVEGNIALRLVRPSQLVKNKKLSAHKIDLLIIDEFTRLQLQVRQDLIAAAQLIPNVLTLTATPSLHSADKRRELMALLEPESVRIAKATNRDILDVLVEREARAIEKFTDVLHDASARRQIEESCGLYRHIIRTRRTDYPNALPTRVYQPIRLGPTDGDIERARSAKSYLSAALSSNIDIRRELLLQVSGRSPQSLRDRLSTLRRSIPAVKSAWEEIDICLREERGDAKLDGLIDHLRGLRSRNSDVRVLVVAEDNPTTDYLGDAIEKLADVKVAKKRRLVGAADELDVQVIMLKEALDAFVSGEAKVLVAADAAREGHNLQFADEIIFFALPWSPPDVQQWIGRIDRLGTKGRPANRQIAITPIVIKGSIEEKILDVLESTDVFLKSEVFDESDWQKVSNAISEAAEGRAGASWTEAAREARALGDSYEAWLLATKLPPSYRAGVAMETESRFRNRPYALPMAPLRGYPWNWYLMRERAVEILIRLGREDYLDVRPDKIGGQHFYTMWYKSPPGLGDLILPDLDVRSSRYRQAYLTRRTAIDCPPSTHVVQKDGEKRQLHFFDHGCTLHDDAVAAFEKQTPATDIHTEFEVEYPEGHPALEWAGCRFLIASTEVDFRAATVLDLKMVLDSHDAKASKYERDARTLTGRIALAQFQADRRWVLDLAPSEMILTVVLDAGGKMVVSDAAAPALLDPIHFGKCARLLMHRMSKLDEEFLDVAKSTAMDRLRNLGEERLGAAKQAVRDRLQSRMFAAQADADNLLEAAEAEVASAKALDQQHEFNRAALRGATLALSLAEAIWSARLTRLEGLDKALGTEVKFNNVRLFWIVPRAANGLAQ